MREMSGDEAREAVGIWDQMNDQQAGAFMTATMAAMHSALRGECADCDCDVCVSLRGIFVGVDGFLASQ